MIKTTDGIEIDIKQGKLEKIKANGGFMVDLVGGTITDTLNQSLGKADEQDLDTLVTRLSKNDGLAWLKQIKDNPDVDWNKVKEIHESWDYKETGLSPTGAMIVSIAIMAITGNPAANFASSITNNIVLQSSIKAGLTTLASQVGVSLVNNKGNLKDVFKDLGSKESLKSLILNIVSAGFTTQIAHGLNGKSIYSNIFKNSPNLEYFARKATIGALQGGITELRGGSFKDGFVGSFAGSYLTKYGPTFGSGSINAAIYGGLASELGGGEFKDGALSAYLTWEFNDAVLNLMYREIEGASSYHHTYLKLVDTDTGRVYWVSAVPSDPDNGSVFYSVVEDLLGLEGDANTGYGRLIVVDNLDAIRNEINYDVISSYSANLETTFDETVNQLSNYGIFINGEEIPYQPLSENSNAFTFSAYELLTGSRPGPVGGTNPIGWDTILED